MYSDSRALAADPTAIISSDSKPKREQIEKRREPLLNHPDMNHQDDYRQYQNDHQQQPTSNSGLLRFRSAPSSLLSNFTEIDSDSGEKGLMNNRCSSPEAQKLTHLAPQSLLRDLEESKPLANGYSLSSELPPQYPRQSSATHLAAMDNNSSYRLECSNGSSSNLMRQSSSPAGLFSHLTGQNGYAALRGFGNYRVGNGTNGDALRGPMNFSSGVLSSVGMLSQISEIENESVGGSCHEDTKLGNGGRDLPQFYSPGYSFGSWNDSSHFQENFSVLKRDLLDDDRKLFAPTQNGELENRTHVLSHHWSLPKTSAEMAVAMEKLRQFQDTVPCKVRAKRGCATHPRSIAERVRRTRISERMRKLQELVPHMDKQTNTADMLDLAVEYIKDLQKQYKILSENRANCKCSSMKKPLSNLAA